MIDEVIRVSDRDSFLLARRITREEGLLVGGSSGTAGVAAVKLAQTLPADSIVVVIFPDSGRGYMSKIFSDDWMIANGFLADAKRRAPSATSCAPRRRCLPSSRYSSTTP